jgi:hypothetical protein
MAGTEFSQAEVPGTSQFKPRRDQRGVELKDGINLDLDAEGGHTGRERSTLDDPPTAVGEDMHKPGQMTLTIVVREALDVERVHVGIGRPGVKFLPSDHSSELRGNVVIVSAHRGHVTSRDRNRHGLEGLRSG